MSIYEVRRISARIWPCFERAKSWPNWESRTIECWFPTSSILVQNDICRGAVRIHSAIELLSKVFQTKSCCKQLHVLKRTPSILFVRPYVVHLLSGQAAGRSQESTWFLAVYDRLRNDQVEQYNPNAAWNFNESERHISQRTKLQYEPEQTIGLAACASPLLVTFDVIAVCDIGVHEARRSWT